MGLYDNVIVYGKCPNCGNLIPFRMYHLDGRVVYSLGCKKCKQKTFFDMERRPDGGIDIKHHLEEFK